VRILCRLGLLCALAFLSGCTEELYRGLTQRDANEMVAVLQDHGIAASREASDASFRLLVEANQFASAVEVLKTAGYPRETFRSLADIFPGDGLITSPYEQRARMVFALDQELTRTISEIEGVASARVHVVMPELDLRGAPQSHPSASVVVHYSPGFDEAAKGPKIRQIVGGAIQGLGYRDVTIAFFPEAERNGRETSRGVTSGADRGWARMASLGATIGLLVAAFVLIGLGGRLGYRLLTLREAAE